MTEAKRSKINTRTKLNHINLWVLKNNRHTKISFEI